MNQILFVPNSSKSFKNPEKSYIKFIFFKLQFFFSILLAIFLMVTIFLYIFHINLEEKKSIELLKNYNLLKLYSSNISTKNLSTSTLFGIITIPKLNLCYPIFSQLSEKNLKVSPCRFSGSIPQEFGNICIAGHNYDNNKFFSNLSKMNVGDEIILSDIFGRHFSYFVSSVYEVENNDFSIVYPSRKKIKELTLLTCNNKNKKRFVVRAIQK